MTKQTPRLQRKKADTDHAVDGAKSALQLIAENMPGTLFQYHQRNDGSGEFTYISDNCENLFGLSQDRMQSLGSTFSFVAREDGECFWPALAESAQRMSEWNHVFRIRRPDGGARWIKTCATPRKDISGALLWEGVFLDVTESKEAEELAVLEQRAKQAEDFISTLAHDMKVPLLGADRILELLLNGSLGPIAAEQAPIIAKLRASNQKLLAMLRDLLDVYRYEAGMQPIRFQAVNIGMQVKACIAQFSQTAEDKDITVQLNLADNPFFAVADANGINLLLSNLIENAVKFTPPMGNIKISAAYCGAHLQIEVSNTGKGIPLDEQDKLFQRFWQGESGKRYVAGTGLGLYLCKRIVDIHKGTISCKSAPDAVTTFSITLPLRAG